MNGTEQREFVHSDGSRFRVRIDLAPRLHGTREGLKMVIFEQQDGEWHGSVPVFPSVQLQELSQQDLGRLFRQAARKG